MAQWTKIILLCEQGGSLIWSARMGFGTKGEPMKEREALKPTSRKQTPTVGYSDYDVFLENDEGSRVYRCKKLF